MQLPVIDPSSPAMPPVASVVSTFLDNLGRENCVPTGPMAKRPLPMTMAEALERGWDELDVVFISGDAYIDHPSFAMAILGRVLEAAGYRVGIVSQPDWHSCEDWRRFGRPRLFFGDQRRKHGFDDQPLHGQQKSPQRRRLFSGWKDRSSA